MTSWQEFVLASLGLLVPILALYLRLKYSRRKNGGVGGKPPTNNRKKVNRGIPD